MSYLIATFYLATEIWNIMSIKSDPFWIAVVKVETGALIPELGLLNIIDIFTTLCNCLFFFVIAVVCMQATQTKSVTSAVYFKTVVKVGFAAITCFSGLTLFLGAITIGRLGIFLPMILWIL